MKIEFFILILLLPFTISTQGSIQNDSTQSALQRDTTRNADLDVSDFTPRINLPDKINAIVGYEHQLFFRGMIEAINPYQWNIKIKGDLGGKQFPRYYQFTPNSPGERTFIIELWNDKNELIATKSCIIYISNVANNPASIKKILCIGDSLTSGGIWTKELLRILTESGGTPLGMNHSNVELIGTVDQGNGNRHEGYGGKTWKWFTNETREADVNFNVFTHDKESADLVSIWQDANANQWKLESILNQSTLIFSRIGHNQNAPTTGFLSHVSGAVHSSDIRYTDISNDSRSAANKFWNNSTNELDFQNYITTNQFGSVDFVISLLTWNGMSGGRQDAQDHETLINDAKIWIDKLHSQYPQCKVILLSIPLPSQNGGLAQSYGDANHNYGNIYDLNQTVFGLNLAYQELANDPLYSSFVFFENVTVQFDSENNMPESPRPVNLRSTKTEFIGTNGVHPNNAGYLQIADIALRALNSQLNH